MSTDEIKVLQARVGAVPDGFWGPKSITACQKHLKKLMPKELPWPAGDEWSLRKFYGSPGDERKLVRLSVAGLGLSYLGKKVQVVRCHERVAESLGRVLAEVAAGPQKRVLARYAGCYNYREMRGGSRLSTHAWGIAVDLDPGNNGNLVPWPVRATMPIEVMEAFAREGWTAAGAFWGRDAMHFQATKA